MASMAGTGRPEPGERPSGIARPERQLERAPGERYTAPPPPDARAEAGSTLAGPLAKAIVAAIIGSALLYALGALLSSSGGLVFVAGFAGAAVGLLLAGAAAPGRGSEPAITRRQATWLAVAIAVGAVALGAVATWLHALGEGGALGFVDYLLETFGAIVPLELLLAAITAAWGASAGPVER